MSLARSRSFSIFFALCSIRFERSAERTQCAKPLYHVQMRSAEGEHLTREQWLYSVEKVERKLGLTGHDRVIVAHTKEGQDHVHIVWNRIDYERGKAAALHAELA